MVAAGQAGLLPAARQVGQITAVGQAGQLTAEEKLEVNGAFEYFLLHLCLLGAVL